jgi:hypothetical protein
VHSGFVFRTAISQGHGLTFGHGGVALHPVRDWTIGEECRGQRSELVRLDTLPVTHGR